MKNAGSSLVRGRVSTALVLGAGAAVLLAVSPAWAAGAGTAMPWEGPLDTIMQSLSGPVAKAVGIIAIVLTGLGFAFAEGGSALRKGIGIVFGLAIAFTATTFISTFFNMTAGAAF
ncbi:TrbC/VirB2 family protein [Phenylobacterium aquaticum]|uniref:TrbC/VirB2 family protein n=1 Tax=Phenylobacterium aquaticum TaxID=1763816 RepID=UPI0023518057|nr:TrbC/VirB2 family protein [Phenylobacterium aquaticum]